MIELDAHAVMVIFVALAAGGILKGALGLGAPLVAVPVMASFFDVRLAVVLMVLPNLATNIWQLWLFRKEPVPRRLAWIFAVSGGLGAFAGTVLLATLSAGLLMHLVAFAVLAFIALRVAKPDFAIGVPLGRWLAAPFGLVAGILQGAAGISAPASVSFLSALRLPRNLFIPTISMFFAAISAVQLPTLLWYGMLNGQVALLGAAALIPLLGLMPLGQWLARRVSAVAFDRIVLVVLALLAVDLIWTG
ncbi:sulfite exporter TauE/SafE family protein [Brevirhabdus sp.]|uniref:sulfite exporter TauE/SafE family protein n=1 Tax=Brevirhabdus sp. TaxID=2004514 RepID=UPI004058F5CA